MFLSASFKAARRTAALLALSTSFFATTPAAHADGVTTIQDHLESLTATERFDIREPMAVFEHVFKSLSDTVKVYPTENYFYFQFYKDGISYSGNIRLDALDRDKGVANFAYFTTYNRWNAELVSKFKLVKKDDGLSIKKLGPLRYALTFKKKTVEFQLNDLGHIKPSVGKITKDEAYLGPVYDESGIQFYLVYNSKLKMFHYVLNQENGFPDVLTPSRSNKNVLVGHRTGFAYYRDPFLDRLLLIGVYEGNSMVNNYFDGPFDQLPDNFIKGDELRNALIDQTPSLKDEIDRYGNTGNGQSRVLITPYMHYAGEWSFDVVEQCVVDSPANDQDEFYRCMDASTLAQLAKDDAEADDTGTEDVPSDDSAESDESTESSESDTAEETEDKSDDTKDADESSDDKSDDMEKEAEPAKEDDSGTPSKTSL